MGHASSRAVEFILQQTTYASANDASCGAYIKSWDGTGSDFVLHGARVLADPELHLDDEYDAKYNKQFLTMHKIDCPHCLAWLDFAFEVKDL